MAAGADAWLALRLFCAEPALAGGIVVRASAGPVRDLWLAELRASLPATVPLRQVPVHVDTERLLGGLDLAATLQRGRPVAQRGLLAESDGGVIVLAMAERAHPATVAQIAAALDHGEVLLARDGIESRSAARFGVVALDESSGDDTPCSEVLLDRLAFVVDLREVSLREAEACAAAARADRAAPVSANVGIADALIEALCAAALALGVRSLRASLFASCVARLHAACAGRDEAIVDDAEAAARLVLAPRATQVPAASDESARETGDDDKADDAPDDREADPEEDADADRPDADDAQPEHPSSLPDELVLAAAAAAIPSGLLARLASSQAASVRSASAGRAGALQAGQRHGRPQGVRRARPRDGVRLDLIATLRAAAPWQRLRGRDASLSSNGQRPPIRIRADDFHIMRKVQRGHTTTIFAVDASGSSALHRLAEAKGAVELLLAECYVRRDSVAVIAFRGRGAELLLSPTRSLVRAKRALAELPGGGGTPLASGLDAALTLALAVRRRGDSPVVVVLTDGRANVGRDGTPGRAAAEADALHAARAVGGAQFSVLLVDTSPQPQPRARELAAAMRGRYLPLPHAGAEVLSSAVRTAAT